jgi:Kdo2-lipid IVA lauroyltransferase/acyltransferase
MSALQRQRREPAGHLVAYLFGRLLFGVLALVPTGAARATGRALGGLFWRVSGRHRRIALRNLETAYGGTLDPEAGRAIARASFAHLGAIVGDATQFRKHLRRPTEALVVYEGVEHLQAAAAAGRGVLVFSGHFGHWEMVALLQHRLGVPMTMVVSPLANRRWDRFITELRSAPGNAIQSKRNAARPILKALRAGRAVAILIDQNVRGDGGLFIDFFGRAASTTPSLATLAFRSGALIVPVFSWFRPDGRLHVSYRPPIEAVRRGTVEDDVRDLMSHCTGLLEAEVRRRPEGWLWMHDRWRTRPGVEAAAGREADDPPEARAAASGTGPATGLATTPAATRPGTAEVRR